MTFNVWPGQDSDIRFGSSSHLGWT